MTPPPSILLAFYHCSFVRVKPQDNFYFSLFQENWFYFLNKELEKVINFYHEKKTEAMRKFNSLKEQLALSEEPNNRNEQDIYIGNRKNAKELKLAFSEFYLNLIIIQDSDGNRIY